MKIGYDAKRLFLNGTGLGNYSRWLVKSAALKFPLNEYYLYTTKTRAHSRTKFIENYNYIKTVTPQIKFGLFLAWWRSKGIVKYLKRDGIQIYHGLSHELPAGIKKTGIKTVVTVHDLIFMRFPENFGAVSRMIYAAKVRYACAIADKIIAVSQNTKNDLVKLLNIAPNHIEVIYQGVDPAFSMPQNDTRKIAVKSKFHLPDQFLLCVGTVETRKNLLLIIKALKNVDHHIPLVVIGKTTAYLDEVKNFINKNDLKGRVAFLSNLAFGDLLAIYQLATVFIYPSRYEGFGIPVLEALNSGVPVIAATGSSLEEAGGPDSVYIHPDDTDGLANEINTLLGDQKLRETMIAKGKLYAAKFADDSLSAQLMDLYNKIIYA